MITPTSFFLVLYGAGILGIGLSALIIPDVIPLSRGLVALAVGLVMSMAGWWMIWARYRGIHATPDAIGGEE